MRVQFRAVMTADQSVFFMLLKKRLMSCARHRSHRDFRVRIDGFWGKIRPRFLEVRAEHVKGQRWIEVF